MKMLLVSALALATVGCNQTTPRTASGSTGAGIGAHCEADEACESGLFCGRGGVAERLCTEICETTGECVARFGDGTVCHVSTCVPQCENDSNCTFGTSCDPVARACAPARLRACARTSSID
jgi:hypothetical protein